MQTIVSHAELIDALGGNKVVADHLKCPPVRVGQWKITSKIPPEYWPELIDLASDNNLEQVNADWLMRTSPRRKNATSVEQES